MVALFPALIVSAAVIALLPDATPFRLQMSLFFDRVLPSNVVPVLESYFLPGLGHGTPIRTSGGEDACGAPGPFILEAGVSSSYRVAQFWGLAASPATTAAGAARSQDRTARPSSSRSREDARPAAANVLQTLNPQKIISGALKAAGLLKD